MYARCPDKGAEVVCNCGEIDYEQHVGSAHNQAVLICRTRCLDEICGEQRATIGCYANQAQEAEEARR